MSLTCVLFLLLGAADAGPAALPLPVMTALGGEVVSVERLRHPAPAEADKELRLAQKARIRGDFAATLEHLDRAIAFYPGFTEAHIELGALRLQQGQTESALIALERAVAINATSLAARLNLGLAQLQAGRVESAGNTARQAVALDPRSPRARYLLAVALERQGNRAAAAAELRAYLDLDGLAYRTTAKNWLVATEAPSAPRQNN
jgi:tetratricopeptide (TPR) repeat protein